MKKHNKGFTLIELMIVVAIIAIIAAIAIPNLLRSRIQANESAAIGNLRTIVSAQTSHQAANNDYGSWEELTGGENPGENFVPYLDGTWSDTAVKAGYQYPLSTTDQDGLSVDFSVTASPVTEGTTGIRFFFVDSSGVIRHATGAAADDESNTLDEAPTAK